MANDKRGAWELEKAGLSLFKGFGHGGPEVHSHTDYWESWTPRLAPYTLAPVYRACVTQSSMLYCTYTASRDSGECGLD